MSSIKKSDIIFNEIRNFIMIIKQSDYNDLKNKLEKFKTDYGNQRNFSFFKKDSFDLQIIQELNIFDSKMRNIHNNIADYYNKELGKLYNEYKAKIKKPSSKKGGKFYNKNKSTMIKYTDNLIKLISELDNVISDEQLNMYTAEIHFIELKKEEIMKNADYHVRRILKNSNYYANANKKEWGKRLREINNYHILNFEIIKLINAYASSIINKLREIFTAIKNFKNKLDEKRKQYSIKTTSDNINDILAKPFKYGGKTNNRKKSDTILRKAKPSK